MALIRAEMRKLGAERFAPEHGVAAIAGVTEVERVRHLGGKAAHQLRIAAIAIAGEDQRIAADAFARAVAAYDLYATDAAIRLGDQILHRAPGEDDDVVCFGRAAQPVDQLASGTARQAVHAQRRM